MTPPRPRAHLVERAVTASGLDLPPLPRAPAAAPPPASPLPDPAEPPPQPLAPSAPQPPPPMPVAAPPVTASPAPSPPPMPAPVSSPVPPRPAPPVQQPRPVSPPAGAVPVGSAIPAAALVAAGLVASPDGSARPRVAEEMKLVQQQVLRGIEESPCERGRVVLVTSARAGEGKTFVALNLAAAMAASGQRPVVLVDADGRRGALSDTLGAPTMPGLWDLALSPSQGRAPLLPTATERLFFLPRGGATARPGVTLPAATALAEAVARLARSLPNHVLVLDTPPSLSTSNAHALAPHAGQVVMVVAAEGSRNEEVEAALDMVEACPRLQLLLNRVRLNVRGSFGTDHGKDGTRAA